MLIWQPNQIIPVLEGFGQSVISFRGDLNGTQNRKDLLILQNWLTQKGWRIEYLQWVEDVKKFTQKIKEIHSGLITQKTRCYKMNFVPYLLGIGLVINKCQPWMKTKESFNPSQWLQFSSFCVNRNLLDKANLIYPSYKNNFD